MKVIEIRNKEDYNININDEILLKSFNIYCRVSTENQIENTSLNGQRDRGIEFIKSNFGIDEFKYIIIWREEGKSGDDLVYDDEKGDYLKREILTLIMIKWVEKKIKNIWVEHLDRLSRNSESQTIIKQKIYRYGVNLYVEKIRYDFDNKTDKLMFNIISSFNEFENTLRFEKLTNGKLRILEDDKHWGGIVPFGYVKDESGRLIEGKKSKLVKMIFNQYKDGRSIRYISNKLEHLRVKTQRNNSKWNDGSVKIILQNDIYCKGEMKFEVKLLKSKSKEYCREKGYLQSKIIKIPKLIDDELYNEVQKKFEKNKLTSKKKIINKTLLNGMIICGSCGNRFHQKVNDKIGMNLYFCSSNTKKWKDDRIISCKNVRSINISFTDDLIWFKILEVFRDSERIRDEFRIQNLPKEYDPNNINIERKRLIKEIEKLDIKLNKIEDRQIRTEKSYGIGKMSDRVYNEVIDEVYKEIGYIKKEKEKIYSKISILESGLGWEDWFNDFEKYFEIIEGYRSIEEKRKFIENYIDDVIVNWDEITKTHNLKINFKLPLIKDRGEKISNDSYKLINGKKTLNINKLDIQSLMRKWKKIKESNTIIKNHSTVTDYVLNIVNDHNKLNLNNLNELLFLFTVSLYSSNLTNTNHYNSQQQLLFDEVKYLKQVMNLNYNQISIILRNKGYKSVRSNQDLLPNYIYSIYKKGIIRENRLNKEFDNYYYDLVLINI
jgi:site-specific DNA recombinase